MPYLDANVFISAELDKGILGNFANEVLIGLGEDKFSALTSVLTVDEVVHAIRKETRNIKIAVGVGKKMFELPNLAVEDATSDIVLKGLEIVEKYGLRPRDAIHVATMIEKNIKEIVTEDPDFKKINEIKSYSMEEFLRKLK